MKLYIQPVVNIFQTNAYFFIDEKTKHGFLIDPGVQGELLLKLIDEKGWEIEKVLLTHGHFDHSYQAAKVADTLHIPVVVNEHAKDFMANDDLNLAHKYHQHVAWPKNVIFTKEDELIWSNDKSFNLQAIYTPGHTPDSQIFYSKENNLAIVGDMVYDNNIGLTIFPKGDKELLLKSIKEKICALPDTTYLLSGHNSPMIVGQLKQILASDYGIRI